jgi:hypothetical protein
MYGGKWNREKQVWKFSCEAVKAFGLTERIVKVDNKM